MLTKRQLEVSRILAQRELYHIEKEDRKMELYAEFLRRLIEAIDREFPDAPQDIEMDLTSVNLITHKKSPGNGG